ncbi:MAG: MOSC domain-containing protein [Burkholderiaceae bacterium]|nr:MOSC domain-containing protein [Burkholderiaceae bacterium]
MRILSINTGRVEQRLMGGRSVATAIAKQPRSGAIAYGPLGLEGDEQADPTVHGGLAKAIYAYPSEHLPFWRTVRAQAQVAGWQDQVPPGLMGENLTLSGLLEKDLWVGDRLHFADGGVLVVSEPRYPCFKFNAVMGFAKASKLMVESGYCGTYLAVLVPGALQANEAFTLEPGERALSLADAFRARTKGKDFG